METMVIPTASAAKKRVCDLLNYTPQKAFSLCPVKDVLHMVSDKWSLMVMMRLGAHETLRFGELKSATKGISQKMLTTTLRELESFGLVSRKVFAEVPPRVEYTITPHGVLFLQHLVVLLDWACNSLPELEKRRLKKPGAAAARTAGMPVQD